MPPGVEVVALPPVGLGQDGKLASRDGRRDVRRAMELRREMILDAYRRHRPRVVMIELFPFGRKKFGDELLPLLELAHADRPRPLVVCSVRDILVGRSDQPRARRAGEPLGEPLVRRRPRARRPAVRAARGVVSAADAAGRPGELHRLRRRRAGPPWARTGRRGPEAGRRPGARVGRWRDRRGAVAARRRRGRGAAARRGPAAEDRRRAVSPRATPGARCGAPPAGAPGSTCGVRSPTSARSSTRPPRRSASAATTPRSTCCGPASRRSSSPSPTPARTSRAGGRCFCTRSGPCALSTPAS